MIAWPSNMTQSEKFKASMIAKYGSEDLYKAEMRRRASVGGKKKVSKGFGKMTAEKRAAAGKRGGKVSKRRKPVPKVDIDLVKDLGYEDLDNSNIELKNGS